MNPTLQNPNDIIQAISQLGSQLATSAPAVSVPSLNIQLPNVSDLDSKYTEFLNRASNDPDIVNYYNQLLQQAQGDTQIAQNFLENDYQTGVRNTVTNLTNTLQTLGLQNQAQNRTLQDTLNQRGIALTDMGQGKNPQYAQGGEAGYEVGQLSQQQALRQQAEQNSAKQNITGLGSKLQQGISDSGRQLTQVAQNLQQQKQQAIGNRASTYYSIYQDQQAANLAKQQQINANLGPKPANPRPGTSINVDTRQNGYRWNGNSWEVVQ